MTCKNCCFWKKTGNTEVYDFSSSQYNWGICTLTVNDYADFSISSKEHEKRRVESGKPIAICSSEGIMDSELMTIEDFSCSEEIPIE